MGHLGGMFVPSWPPLGPLVGRLGSLWGRLRDFLGRLGDCLGVLERSRRPLETSWPVGNLNMPDR